MSTADTASREAELGPGVGVDEWVARSVDRREYLPGWRGNAQRRDRAASAGGRASAWPPRLECSSRSSSG